MKTKTDDESKKKLKDIQNKLADKMADDMFRIVKEEVSKVDAEAGGFNSGHLWKLKSKLRPKFNDYPTAILDTHGNLATTKEEIQNATVNHYKDVLRNRPILPNLEEHKVQREELCNMRIDKARKNKTPRWTEDDVTIVIKGLKRKNLETHMDI